MSGWTKCSDQMPEIHQEILFYSERVQVGHLCEGAAGRWFFNGDVIIELGEVTHWMPVPEAPK